MKFDKQAFKKLSAAYFSSLLFIACAQNPGDVSSKSSASCEPPQNRSFNLQQVSAQGPVPASASAGALVRKGQTELLGEISDLSELENLKQDLQREDSSAQIKVLSENSISIQLSSQSSAATVLERYVSQGTLKNLEADGETFLIRPGDEGEVTETFANAAFEVQKLAAASMDPVAEELFQRTQGKTVVVAVIDSGVDYTHKDLAPYMWKNPREVARNGIDDDRNGYVDDIYGWDFASEDNNPMADDEPSYHGTHVAGIVKQAALLAEKGINVRIMALKYMDAGATGRTSHAIRAIDYALKNGATVLNNSWGAPSYSAALYAAIQRTQKAKTLFIAAAGNGDAYGNGINIDRVAFYPAAYGLNNIISVAASNYKSQLAPWSNYGSTNVDLAAPGVSVRSTRNGNKYASMSGTSMAAPYVAGVAAMLWSLRPDLSYTEVRRVLFSSVTKASSFSGKMSTNGEINRSQAVQVAANYTHDPNDLGMPEVSPNDVCQ